MASVITDTECRGSSTEKLFPALMGPPVVLTASGVANPFTAASESATTRFTTASGERFAPRTLIRVCSGRSRSVLTALMKIRWPSADRLALTSSTGIWLPSRVLEKVGPSTSTASRVAPRCAAYRLLTR